MNQLKKFEVVIKRELDVTQLRWPRDARDETGLGGNRQYFDVRGARWGVVKRTLELEHSMIAKFLAAPDFDKAVDEYEAEQEAHLESGEIGDLDGFDLGLASSVWAISAARCIPFSSCNAGTFGGRHHEGYPLVSFYIRRVMADVFLDAAAEANAGLHLHEGGFAVLYGQSVDPLMQFAEGLWRRRKIIDAIRLR